MYHFWKYEFRSGMKNRLLWTCIIGGMGFFCMLLFRSMEADMEEIAKSMASMGAFAEAFGMNTLSVATVSGYFSTEIGTIHSLGSCLFAASLGSVMLSKEEDGHTGEFTFTFPLSRRKIIWAKYSTVLLSLLLFTVGCGAFYGASFLALKERISFELVQFLGLQFLMNVEIATICFFLSAVSRKNKVSVGICIGVLAYMFDLMARVVPVLKNKMFLSPFSYANATTIFSKERIDGMGILFGVMVSIFFGVGAFFYYEKKDLVS